MRSFPHQPDPAPLTETLREILADLDATSEGSEFSDDGDFLIERSERYRHLGLLYCFHGAPLSDVAKHLRVSALMFHRGCKVGGTGDAEGLWNAFHAALAVGAPTTAECLASVPNDCWIDPEDPPDPTSTLHLQIVFRLFRNQDRLVPPLFEQLKAFVAEISASDSGRVGAEMQNSADLLAALHTHDSASFNRHLAPRMNIREKIFRESPTDPDGLMDLPGLGLCRLARLRGMRVNVKHAYLPLEMLDISMESR